LQPDRKRQHDPFGFKTEGGGLMIRLARPEVEMPASFGWLRRGLFEVVPDVACLQLSIVNVYLVGDAGAPDRGWFLVDAGLMTSGPAIRAAAAERFGPNSRPSAIVLTHGHFDHVGALRDLAETWDVPIYAHELELPYLTGRSSYPPPDPAVGRGAMSFLSRFYSRGPIDVSDRVRMLPPNTTIPGAEDWRWIHTPGHAPGHISLFRDSDRTLIVGDAFVTLPQESALAVLTQSPREVHRPPAYFTPDWEMARRSVEALALLRPDVAATGHGIPMEGEELRVQLDTLVRDWGRLAVPEQGRYVHRPAITGPDGVESVPPPVPDPQLAVAAGVGLAALIGSIVIGRVLRGPRDRA
jgi:glyoxylase-like metal-dependent hydrolase (beta-lactamase superfamily II)